MWINILLVSIGLLIGGCEYFGYHVVIESDHPLIDKVEDYIEDKTGVKVDITYPAKPNEKPRQP